MKIHVLSFLFLLSTALSAQIDCNKFLAQGKKAAKQENFELAMNSFNSARRCGDKHMGELVDKEVDKLFNTINLKKEQAEQQKQRAEEMQRIAEQEKQRAQEQTKIAQVAREEAEHYLKKFEAASAEIVDALVREANSFIYHLDYTAAATKLLTAADLNHPTAAFKKTLAEVAFFWNEAGQTTQVSDLLSAAKQADVPCEKAPMQAWLKHYAGTWYDSLLLRYYNKLIFLQGGEAVIKDKKALISSYKIARTETTFWQFALYTEATGQKIQDFSPPWGLDGDNPAVNVSWYDAVLYANWLSTTFNLTPVYTLHNKRKDSHGEYEYDATIDMAAKGYRLPTEIEWEYCAHSGPLHETFEFCGTSDKLESFAWYSDNSDTIGIGRTRPVGTRLPNSLGLRDLSGNVWEWCNDWSTDYPAFFRPNYHGPDSGDLRVIRGGGWASLQPPCRPGYRLNHIPAGRDYSLGFRFALQL